MKYFLFLTMSIWSVQAQLPESKIDNLVERTLKTFDVPGIAVAVVKDGKIVHAKGYGVRSIKTKQKVDANTLFGIASNSKAFTAAALAILVDEGKINWDDKVVKHIPEFKMYDDYVTNEFTIRDLLTHRSGLGLGAGDLMVWPDGNDFQVQDIVQNLRYLKPTSAFRTKYDYDNLLYIVAGEVVHRASGMSWNDFVETRIMQPIGMKNSASSFHRLKDTANTIDPHVPIDGKLQVISRYKLHTFDAAAGLYASVNDLSNWLLLQMGKGEFNGKRIYSEKQAAEMWTPQTIMTNKPAAPYFSNFKTYGLGWQLTDVNGKLQVSHTGGLEGIVTQTLMIPQLNLGIVVLTNQQAGSAFNAISNTIKDSYLGLPEFDHVQDLAAKMRQRESDADKVTEEVWATVNASAKQHTSKKWKPLLGTFRDNWFGEVRLFEKNGKLYIASKRSPQLAGEVFFYKENNYVVRWNNRYFHADAHILWDGNDHFTMKPISPLTDFSYDFQDLDFVRAKN